MENNIRIIKASLEMIKNICEHNKKWEYHETVSDYELISRQIVVIQDEIKEIEKKKEEARKDGKDFMRSGVVGGLLINEWE